MRFRDQRFIITGAASGIGLAVARRLKAEGARLVLWDRNASGLHAPAAELAAVSRAVDVTQVDDVRDALAEATAALGGLDGVFHSAGILSAGLFEQVDIQAHRRVVEVNLFGTVNVAHAALTGLRASRGSLVMMASSSAFYGPPEYAVYGATKAGVLNFAQALRAELSGSGVHIGVVSPLFVATPMLEGYNGQTRLIRSRSFLFSTHSAEFVAARIVEGIAGRRFMILPGWRERALFTASRSLSFMMHRLTLLTYRQGGG
jgi:meso-butanediol dehydrogenase/(S,S)-butanediol dehydrogenase/diacetyl reductase